MGNSPLGLYAMPVSSVPHEHHEGGVDREGGQETEPAGLAVGHGFAFALM